MHDNALFVKVKKKITINFRNLFDTAIGLRLLEMAYEGFQIWKFSRGACPQTPLVARAFGARNSYSYHKKLSNFSLIISWLDIAYNSNINYLVRVLEVRIPPPHDKSWLRVCMLWYDMIYDMIWYDILLCYAMLCYDILGYAMLCYVMLCYVMLCYVMLCYVMLCYVMTWYDMILCYAMLWFASHDILWHAMLCYILCYIILHYVITIIE